MMKIVKAVEPYQHKGYLNFKQAPYEAWVKNGGRIASPFYPPQWLHGFAYKYELPNIQFFNKQEAILMFVEPVSITFDSFPYYATHEIIPLFWDCWPSQYEKVIAWIKKYKIKTALFTSIDEMNAIKERIPKLITLHCPEAVNPDNYCEGKALADREIDLLEFGRGICDLKGVSLNSNAIIDKVHYFHHITTRKEDNKFIYSREELPLVMQNAKITICLPKSITHPQKAGGIETLTQRYWEAMLSRMIIVGHCPKELEDLIGYNPIIELPTNISPHELSENITDIIANILINIDKYQELVDKNRDAALHFGNWNTRMKDVQNWLVKKNYKV